MGHISNFIRHRIGRIVELAQKNQINRYTSACRSHRSIPSNILLVSHVVALVNIFFDFSVFKIFLKVQNGIDRMNKKRIMVPILIVLFLLISTAIFPILFAVQLYGTMPAAVTDTYEWDPEEGRNNGLNGACRVNNSQFYLTVANGDTGSDTDGLARTIKVWNNNGTIKKSVVSTYRYDITDGMGANVRHISGTDKYVIAYRDIASTKTTFVTLQVWDTNGTINPSNIDTQECTYNGQFICLIGFTQNVFVVSYTEMITKYCWMESWWIGNDGLINGTQLDIQEIDATYGNFSSMCIIDSNTIGVTYHANSATGDYVLTTYNITSSGIITNTPADSWTFTTSPKGASSDGESNPVMNKIGSNVYDITYIDSDADVQTKTCTIANTGMITKSWIDTLLVFASIGTDYLETFVVQDSQISANGRGILGTTVQGDAAGYNYDGWMFTWNVTSAGVLDAAVIDSLEFDTADNKYFAHVEWVNQSKFLIIWSSSGSDGWSGTLNISKNWATPTFASSSPTNNSVGQALTSQCAITINDQNGDTMNLSWYSSTDGSSWTYRSHNNSVGNGTYYWTDTLAIAKNTIYYWKVTCCDSFYNVSNWYRFTTLTNNAPTISTIPSPTNGSTGISLNPSCKVWVNDSNAGDKVSAKWYTNKTGSWTLIKTYNGNLTGNSKTNYTFTNFNTASTKYYWRVVANDSYGGLDNHTFYFTTLSNNTAPTMDSFNIDTESGATAGWDWDNNDAQMDWATTDTDADPVTVYITYNKGSTARLPTIADYDYHVQQDDAADKDCNWETTAGWTDYDGPIYVRIIAYDGTTYSTTQINDTLAEGIDGTDPTGTIDAIADNVEPDTIEGDSVDAISGIISNDITIYDSTESNYWTGSVWGASTWLDCTGTTAWTYDSSGISWKSGHSILITLRIYNGANRVDIAADTEAFVTTSAGVYSGPYYVNDTFGSDDNNGSLTHPFKTIQKAVNVSTNGDTIYVMAGTYLPSTGRINIDDKNTANTWLTIRNYNNDYVIVDGTNCPHGLADVGGAYINATIEMTNSKYVRISGIKVNHSAAGGITLRTATISHIRIDNCTISNSSSFAFKANNGFNNITFEYNYVYNNFNDWSNHLMSQETISFENIKTFSINNNTIINNHAENIDMKGGCKNGEVCYNEINTTADYVWKVYANWGGLGVYLDARGVSSNISIYNNLIYGNVSGISINTETTGHYENISIYNNIVNITNTTGGKITVNGRMPLDISLSGTSTDITFKDIYVYSNTFRTDSKIDTTAGIIYISVKLTSSNLKRVHIVNNILYTDYIAAYNLPLLNVRKISLSDNIITINNNSFNRPPSRDIQCYWNGTQYTSATNPEKFGGEPVFTNPLFVDKNHGNFHLNSTSPCIDNGSSVLAPSFDFDDNPRPSGNGFDIGAYEYQSAFGVSISPSIWNGGFVPLGTSVCNNFSFWQNGTTTIDIVIGINGTNYTFVNYATWKTSGHDRYCANFTTNTWSTETSITPGYPFTSVLKNNFAPGSFNMGIRIWMPKTVSYANKREDFVMTLTVSQHT